MEDSEIKALTPIECPHCKKPIVIEFITNAPVLSNVYTPEIIENAKQEALKQIEELIIPEEISKPTIEWIKDPNTIFGPNDIEEIIKNIKKQNTYGPEEEA